MKLRKTLCFLLAMIMAFAIAFPGSIFAEEYFPEEELVFEEENSFSDNWIEEELIDELTSSDIVDDYYEDWIEDEFVDYDQPSLNEEVELVEEDEVLLEEPTEEADNEVPDTEDTEVIGELVLVDNETFEAGSGITITKQPEDASAALGQYATVTVEAEGENLSYQWYYKTANGTAFKASSAKTNTYSVKMGATQVGMQLYCKISNGTDSVDSNIVTLSLPATITITKQPEDASAALGQYATVTVEAEGDNLSYQWYYKTVNDTEFKAGAQRTNTYRVKMSTIQVDMQVFCRISNGTDSIDSEIATLSLSAIISGDFVFKKIDGTNNLTLIEYTGNASSVTVPGSVDGMTVTEIGVSPLGSGEKGIFEDNTTLTSITLPNSITAIREKAFKGCTNLSTMSTY